MTDGLDEKQFLITAGLSQALIDDAERLSGRADVSLTETLVANGTLAPDVYCDRLSQTFGIPRPHGTIKKVILDGPVTEVGKALASARAIRLHPGDMAALNGQAVPLQLLGGLTQALGADRQRVKLFTRQQLINAVTRSYGRHLTRQSVNGLGSRNPALSAKSGLTPAQAIGLSLIVGLFFGAAAIIPAEAFSLAAILLSIPFAANIALKTAAILHAVRDLKQASKFSEPRPLADAELPRYSVLVPLFRETEILPQLAEALRNLDYPPAKLDIKIVLESVDHATIQEAIRHRFPGNVDFIVVPDSQPRTKPKALNYALHFATGEFAVIFDAEDCPEPDQLRKAAAAFRAAPDHVVCLQARLDYYNAGQNWLSKLFTIEYASLFAGTLPLLSRYGLPLPLGGTSNHFRLAALRKLGAWDAFNVTEDADLGMRLHRAGLRAQMLDSTTFEEACCSALPWLKQRTRWLKGWMQTYGVHLRHPSLLWRQTGFSGFFAFQAYFAGTIIAALAHPLAYAVFIWQAATGSFGQDGIDTVTALAVVNFIGGYVSAILLGYCSLRKTRHKNLSLYLIYIPIYWLWLSAAAYRALWQLAKDPFLWEKTPHGRHRHSSAKDAMHSDLRSGR